MDESASGVLRVAVGPTSGPATSTRSSPSARTATTWSSRPPRRPRRRRGDRVGALVRRPSPSWSPSGRSTRSTRSTSPTRPAATDRQAQDPRLLRVPAPARASTGCSASARPRPAGDGMLGRPGRRFQRPRPHPPDASSTSCSLRPGHPGAGHPGPAPAHLAPRRPHRAHRGLRLRQARPASATSRCSPLGDGALTNRMVQVEYGDDVTPCGRCPWPTAGWCW